VQMRIMSMSPPRNIHFSLLLSIQSPWSTGRPAYNPTLRSSFSRRCHCSQSHDDVTHSHDTNSIQLQAAWPKYLTYGVTGTQPLMWSCFPFQFLDTRLQV